MFRRTDTSSVLSLATSPRALTPTPGSAFELLDDEQPPDDTWTTTDDNTVAPPSELDNNNQSTGHTESAEETLRELLVESNKIKEMVSEAETRARSWLQTKTTPLVDYTQQSVDGSEDGSCRTEDDVDHLSGTDNKVAAQLNDDQQTETIRFRQRPASICMAPSTGNDEVQQLKPTSSSPLRTAPSYVELYNEELIENNKRCYMQ